MINNSYIEYQSFSLRGENEVDAKEWMEALETVIDHLKKKREKLELEGKLDALDDDQTENEERYKDKNYKFWKIRNIDKKSYDVNKYNLINYYWQILQKCCGDANINESNQLSQKCLEIKGWNKFLTRIPKDKLENRIQFGWLYKLSKGPITFFQKRWVILISSRVLFPDKVMKDDCCIENVFPPDKFIFNSLYYYAVDDQEDISEPLGSVNLE